MEIIFLGTGGGRINLLQQKRWTGGFRINGSSCIHVDPGPGALVHSIALKQNPLHLDAIIVTHLHIDHCSDANVLAEAMSQYTLKTNGVIIGSANAINGDEKGDRGLSTFHMNLANEVYAAKWGESRKFKTRKGEFEIELVKAKHEEKSAFGFKLHMDGYVIGHTSDTAYFEGMEKQYSGCDILIINAMKPEKDRYGEHLDTEEIIKILKSAKPKVALLTHLGMKMLREGPEKEAAKIEKESNVRTIAAKDGMSFRPDFQIR